MKNETILQTRQAAFLGALALLLAAPGASHGDTVIHIDCGDAQGTPGGNWNLLTIGGSTTDLIDFSTGTGIDVSTDLDFGTASGTDFWNAKDWVPDTAGDDNCSNREGVGVRFVTISNLPGPATIEVVSSAILDTFRTGISIDGNFADRTFENATVSGSWNGLTDGR